MQKTGFDFEVLIHDDASTDGTSDIIREYEKKYPNIIKPIYQKENQYSKGVLISLTYQFPRAKGKYIALCEGDDYWTDPYKLQKQVDFMEANPEYSLCFSRFSTYNQQTGEYQPDENEHLFIGNPPYIIFDFKIFYEGWHLGVQTLVFRNNLFDYRVLNKYKYTRDIHIITHLLLHGNGAGLNFQGAIYRVHSGGIHSGEDDLQHMKIGYLCYKELYRNNREVNYLKLKYIRFTEAYKGQLLQQKKYRDVFFLVMNNRIVYSYRTLFGRFFRFLLGTKSVEIE